MSKFLLFILCLAFYFDAPAQKTFHYPLAPKDSTINHYFDTTVYDPYQWMENPNDPRLQKWLESQKKITDKQGNKASHYWTLLAQLADIYNETSTKTKVNYVKEEAKLTNKYEFKTKTTSNGKGQDLLYRLMGSKNNFKMLMKTSDYHWGRNDNLSITSHIVNEELDIVAIETSYNGSDWHEIYFFDLVKGTQLDDKLSYLRGTPVIWNGNGVYYDRYNKPDEGKALLDKARGQALYYHKMGTNQFEDKLLYQNPDTTGTNHFRYLALNDEKLFFYNFYKVKGKFYKALSYAMLNGGESFFLKNFLIYPNDKSINFTIEELFADTVILYTNSNAPNGKVLGANINEVNKPFEIIPEYDIILREVNRLGKDKLACTYRNEGKFTALIFDLNGKLLKKIDNPVGKKIKYLSESNTEVEYTDFCISSFYHPDIWYQLSLNDLTIKSSETVYIPFDAKKLETKYVKFTSKDGTKVPMYITHLKTTHLNGSNPTILYGYGGYGTTLEPRYDKSLTLWLLHGGVLAIPNVRGGGAGGSNWALEGSRLKKQNTIDDFIAAAEYLIKEKYTNSEKLAIKGGSHGGMLVGAAITQRPELFKAAMIEAGVLDMLRFDKYTVASVNTNISEFGHTSNHEDFLNMKSYSPLHNIKKGVKYPNTLIITGDSDDRVPPFHSYKFLATLQEKGSSESLYQLYVIPGAGHGGAQNQKDFQDQLMFKYDFLFKQLGLKFW